jgi:thiamine-monophosphate kinase
MLDCFDMPQPRIAQGLALRGVASACIDISDGLAADLGHILEKSRVGASLQWDSLPLSPQVRDYVQNSGDWQMPLTAGDDYELCFTVAAKHGQALPAGCICVGEIEAEPGMRIQRDGRQENLKAKGYEHFS